MIDETYANYKVSYPFQITSFRSLYDSYWEEAYTFSGERHDFWEFSCVLEGEVEAVHGEKILLLKPGNFFCCPPMVFHRSKSTCAPCHYLNFSFEHTGKLPEIFAEGIFFLSSAEIEEMKQIIFRLQKVYLQDPPRPDQGAEAACALTSLLIRISEHHTPHTHLIHSRSGMAYQNLVRTMQEALHENLTIQEIVSRNGVSTTTAKGLFRTYAGISPKAYYAEMRGNEALRLLKTGMEITEVSELMNYSSPNYFSYSFKKQFGLPPGQYLRQFGAKEP